MLKTGEFTPDLSSPRPQGLPTFQFKEITGIQQEFDIMDDNQAGTRLGQLLGGFPPEAPCNQISDCRLILGFSGVCSPVSTPPKNPKTDPNPLSFLGAWDRDKIEGPFGSLPESAPTRQNCQEGGGQFRPPKFDEWFV